MSLIPYFPNATNPKSLISNPSFRIPKACCNLSESQVLEHREQRQTRVHLTPTLGLRRPFERVAAQVEDTDGGVRVARSSDVLDAIVPEHKLLELMQLPEPAEARSSDWKTVHVLGNGRLESQIGNGKREKKQG